MSLNDRHLEDLDLRRRQQVGNIEWREENKLITGLVGCEGDQHLKTHSPCDGIHEHIDFIEDSERSRGDIPEGDNEGDSGEASLAAGETSGIIIGGR